MNKLLIGLLSFLVALVIILSALTIGIAFKLKSDNSKLPDFSGVKISKEESLPKEEPPEKPSEPQKTVSLNCDSLKSAAEEVYYGVYYFKSGESVLSESAKTPSASVIKIFIMEYIYSEIAAGRIAETDTVQGKPLRSLVDSMIRNSDNDATNILITEFGMDKINGYITSCGYKDTVLGRKMLDFDAKAKGMDNYTSLDDVMAFLKKLYTNKETYPYNTMLEIMKGQNVRTKIPVNLPAGTEIANKTGELSDVENDVGIVFTEEGDFIVAVLMNKTYSSGNARNEISKFARNAYDLR